MPRGKKKKTKIELKYSLLNEAFVSRIGKRLTSGLKTSISNWTKDKDEKSANDLIDLYVQALSTYWKKIKMKDTREYALTTDFDLIVDLVYKKGRKPNSIRLENNTLLKEELLKLSRAQ